MKKLIGHDLGSYTFNATGQTITLGGIETISNEQILLITNVTDGIIVYNFADPNKGATVSANTITLEYDTTSMSDDDSLQVYIDVSDVDAMDYNLNLLKTQEQSPDPFYYSEEPSYSETLTSTDTYYYPIPMKTYKGGSITFEATMGTGSSATTKVYLTNDPDEDIGTITIENWFDDTQDLMGVSSFVCAAGETTKKVIHMDTNWGCQYLLIEVDYSDDDDSTIDIKSYLNY
jgi:hypothetical protein